MVGHLERYASIAVMDQEWRVTLNCWPPPGIGLELPYPPLIEISDISIPNLTFDPAGFRGRGERPGFPPSSILPLATFGLAEPAPGTGDYAALRISRTPRTCRPRSNKRC